MHSNPLSLANVISNQIPLREITRKNLNSAKPPGYNNLRKDIKTTRPISSNHAPKGISRPIKKENMMNYSKDKMNLSIPRNHDKYDKLQHLKLNLYDDDMDIPNEPVSSKHSVIAAVPIKIGKNMLDNSPISLNITANNIHHDDSFYRRISEVRPQTTMQVSKTKRLFMNGDENRSTSDINTSGDHGLDMHGYSIPFMKPSHNLTCNNIEKHILDSAEDFIENKEFERLALSTKSPVNHSFKGMLPPKPTSITPLGNKLKKPMSAKVDSSFPTDKRKLSAKDTYGDILRKHLMLRADDHVNISRSKATSAKHEKRTSFIGSKPSATTSTTPTPTISATRKYPVPHISLPKNNGHSATPCITTKGEGMFDDIKTHAIMTERKSCDKKIDKRESLATPLTNKGGQPQHSLNDFKMEKVLGQGSYAIVKLAHDKTINQKVAVKIYEKYRLVDPRRMKNVRREIEILAILEHPNVIKMHYSFDTAKQINIIMEYVGMMSLHGYVKSKTGKKLEEFEVKRVFKEIVEGISYCHAKNVVHRDIKMENILIDDSKRVKIIDFGFSICIPSDKKLNIFCGTPSYMAPEIVNKTNYKGNPADIWALGILLFAMLTGSFPFRGFDDKDLFKKISRGKYDPPVTMNHGARDLLEKILKVDPEQRITASHILQDKWLNSQEKRVIE